MEPIRFIYTRQFEEAQLWGLNFKLISLSGDIFYTSRVFFMPYEYFKTLFGSSFKENLDNSLKLPLSTETLDKYCQILAGNVIIAIKVKESLSLAQPINEKKSGATLLPNQQKVPTYNILTFTDQELVDLVEIADQQDLAPIVRYLLLELIDRNMIDFEDLFRLIDKYDLKVELKANYFIHADDITKHFDRIDEATIWDCFILTLDEVRHYKIYYLDPPIPFEEYKRIALTIHDRFPDKAILCRQNTAISLGKKPSCVLSKRMLFDKV